MLKNFIKNNWQILSLELLIILIFTVFFGRFGDIIVDSYREVYIPQQILEGKCIYKDIFVIYPPLAYLINAFLMKIFGADVNTLYFAGLFCTIGIIYFTFEIAKKLLGKTYSLSICLFLISGLVLSPNVFNSIFPYSFGILYGIFFILICLYCILNKKFTFSYLFYSLAILCKYEFVLLFPLLIFWTKKNNWGKNCLAFTTPILFTFGILFLQGLRLEDINTTIQITYLISSSKTLYWFYSVMGLTFRLDLLPVYISGFLKFLVPVYWFKYQEVLIWIFPTILLTLIFRFRLLKEQEKFFIIASLLISIKVFFALTLQSYGVYFLPFALISMFILTPAKFRKILFILLIIWSLIIAGLNIKNFSTKKTELNKVVKYIKANTKLTDTVVVYPECLALNVLSHRKSDNKFYSLIPLYVETFGEKLIIERLNFTKPKYIIINDYDTSAYYFQEFGTDYAQNIFKWIEKNYIQETEIEDNWKFKVYRSL